MVTFSSVSDPDWIQIQLGLWIWFGNSDPGGIERTIFDDNEVFDGSTLSLNKCKKNYCHALVLSGSGSRFNEYGSKTLTFSSFSAYTGKPSPNSGIDVPAVIGGSMAVNTPFSPGGIYVEWDISKTSFFNYVFGIWTLERQSVPVLD